METKKRSTVYDCSMIELDRHHHEKGNITVVENSRTIPFDVRRVYYLYDVPGGESRGGHAHRALRQLIVSAGGSFDVTLDDGFVKRTFTLNRPYQGLLVVPGIWRELNNFSSGSVCLVLASHEYDEADYIRSYDEFIRYKQQQ
ncbi:MAG TPA: FdtA/QdtA family cupin domain-containing protein [Candidatus Rikenella faecigallinarum]|uniref:FdtA/QdtA family cupin domain-containing protein n=1 Tax=Candidatus Rikenella faecigallinarum TaxID=2838745 RepID=A0A9D1QAT5_9BACT|nr:FdtA/QdtA family cupin domain-containing protein [Candidatus Rikenella faecigallinarum]